MRYFTIDFEALRFKDTRRGQVNCFWEDLIKRKRWCYTNSLVFFGSVLTGIKLLLGKKVWQ